MKATKEQIEAGRQANVEARAPLPDRYAECRVCGTPITTSARDREHGEPFYLLDLVAYHDPASWECWSCAHKSLLPTRASPEEGR